MSNASTSQIQYPCVGIKDTPVPKAETWETENLDKAISFDQKGASMCSLQLSQLTAVLVLRHKVQLTIPFTLYLTKIKTPATKNKEFKIEIIQPFHLPKQFSIKSVKGSFIPEFSASSLDRVANPCRD
jgi:hypothetical protein